LQQPEEMLNRDYKSEPAASLYIYMCYMLNQYSYKYANPVIGSFSLYLLPVFAYFSAYILLGEKLTAGLFIGTVIVFISIALTTYAK